MILSALLSKRQKLRSSREHVSVILMHRQETTIDEKATAKYWKIRLGHFIGQEDHEYGDVSSVNEDIIQVGQVFSIEPGIYLMDEGIGVRIEDLVIVTEDGCEVLNHFTKDLIVVPEE